MREVLIGSSADVGSSISRMSGSIARARAIRSRCCWPPDSASALWGRRSLTSAHSAARRSALDDVVNVAVEPDRARAVATLSKIDFGNRLGFWKMRPMRPRRGQGVNPGH